ncbi:MAG: winged helix-turn-helix domain-containing protein [Chloroflexi bacterium]|nr:winged helix-turn-helix domain-containing protein [Chloroflexota bacterium]
MQIPSALFGRAADVEHVCQCAASGACCSIVGVSNLGKSALLRTICDPSKPAAQGPTFVYVDCNRMPERTARAFFITTWHAVMTRLPTAELRAGAQHVYDAMVAASGAMMVTLYFDAGVIFALDHLPRPLVLCFDEFDESYQNLEQQTFLNLRALRDRHGSALVYVTATDRELARLTQSREQGEFYELIAPRVQFLRLMEPDDTRRFCADYGARARVSFSEDDLAFIRENADGHPGLVQAVCYALGAVTGEPVRNKHQDRMIHQYVRENLAADPNVQTECAKIWRDLEPDEHEALLHLHRANPTSANDAGRRGLRNKFIIDDDEDEPHIFSRLFENFVHQQKIVSQPDKRGVYIDVDAGDVWVDGKQIEPLTDLEYRLVLFLYGRLDRVCDKYAIVENVWGEEYIDKVDDTRIEKLVSRVRAKIEADPAHPRYLTSLRGRGYKLTR